MSVWIRKARHGKDAREIGHCGLLNSSDLKYKALCHSSYVNPGSSPHTVPQCYIQVILDAIQKLLSQVMLYSVTFLCPNGISLPKN